MATYKTKYVCPNCKNLFSIQAFKITKIEACPHDKFLMYECEGIDGVVTDYHKFDNSVLLHPAIGDFFVFNDWCVCKTSNQKDVAKSAVGNVWKKDVLEKFFEKAV